MSAANKMTDAGGNDKAARVQKLAAEDAQFRAAFPLADVVAAKQKPGLRLAEIVRIVMEGYGDRPALGQRARELVAGADGRKTLHLLPRFDTITYRELWTRARAAAGEWHGAGFKNGDFVCILGFTSPEYASLILSSIHLGAVIVPLQTSAPAAHYVDIMAETEPHILAVGIDYLGAAIDAVLAGFKPRRLIVFDYDARDDEQRAKFEAARDRLAAAKTPPAIDTLDDVIARGKALPEPPLYVAKPDEDPLAWLFYTSGSTGTPKGAMFTQSLVLGTWLNDTRIPTFTLSFMPMSHLVGNGYLLLTLANGGTSYCAPKPDLSTLFEDLSLARPTMASLVPRVCELFHHHFLGEVDRRLAKGADPATVEEDLKLEMREKILGGRLLSVGCGSASLAPETYAFMEDMLGMHMPIGYSATEIAGGTVLVDWKVQRPPVIAYKLADVPELGYFTTDKPYPRGELLVKAERFMGGYYKRPELTAERFDEEGFYRTGDIMAELGPDNLIYLDRCNNVVKLSQGEFVAVSRLEALYAHSPHIHQIYIYASSERAYLIGVIVPTPDLISELGEKDGTERVKAALRRALLDIAEKEKLNGYEIPRDFLIETEPFSQKNGLLTEIGKHQRPKLRERYGAQLEALFAQLAQDQLNELRALRAGGADRPVLETVSRAVQATLGLAANEVRPEAHFSDLGGDSLSALSFSILLDEIFNVEVPVGVIISPTSDLHYLASYIETERQAGAKRPSFAKVHGKESVVHAADLKLDKFIDKSALAAAAKLAPPIGDVRTVLLTGATGFLGRFQALAWLERLAKTGGRLICLARGTNPANARQRIEAALDTDPALIKRFRALADKHLDVLPGDIGLSNLGLDEDAWKRLAESVDLIVHPAAHVNHVLPYNQLFAANVVGTAELIRLALATRMKRFHYVSTLGVNAFAKALVDEDSDIRKAIASCELDDSYANGYGVSKWACEVLLREAADLCSLPVSIFRPGMILAHRHYAGQLNVPDMFTRLLFSLAATGVAPGTFYAADASKGRPKARYDGLTVDFLAESITAIGLNDTEGFRTYNLAGGGREGDASLDTIVDWMIEAGCKIERIDNYAEWLARFETAMHALPEAQKQESMLNILGPYRQPQNAGLKSALSAQRFQSAAKAAGYDIPQLAAPLIHKYVADLRGLALL